MKLYIKELPKQKLYFIHPYDVEPLPGTAKIEDYCYAGNLREAYEKLDDVNVRWGEEICGDSSYLRIVEMERFFINDDVSDVFFDDGGAKGTFTRSDDGTISVKITMSLGTISCIYKYNKEGDLYRLEEQKDFDKFPYIIKEKNTLMDVIFKESLADAYKYAAQNYSNSEDLCVYRLEKFCDDMLPSIGAITDKNGKVYSIIRNEDGKAVSVDYDKWTLYL